jgi:hypothetical protein
VALCFRIVFVHLPSFPEQSSYTVLCRMLLLHDATLTKNTNVRMPIPIESLRACLDVAIVSEQTAFMKQQKTTTRLMLHSVIYMCSVRSVRGCLSEACSSLGVRHHPEHNLISVTRCRLRPLRGQLWGMHIRTYVSVRVMHFATLVFVRS